MKQKFSIYIMQVVKHTNTGRINYLSGYPRGLSQAFQQTDHDHILSAKTLACNHAKLISIPQKTCPGTRTPTTHKTHLERDQPQNYRNNNIIQ